MKTFPFIHDRYYKYHSNYGALYVSWSRSRYRSALGYHEFHSRLLSEMLTPNSPTLLHIHTNLKVFIYIPEINFRSRINNGISEFVVIFFIVAANDLNDKIEEITT